MKEKVGEVKIAGFMGPEGLSSQYLSAGAAASVFSAVATLGCQLPAVASATESAGG